jgi:cation diffusion facilitator family transporter
MPPRQTLALRRAVRLEWLTLGFLVFSIAIMAATMGGSQAMKTAWLDDVVSALPPVVFLVSERFRRRRANRTYPYGFHRAVSIAFLLSSFALVAMGSFLLWDGASVLVRQHRPTIGTMDVGGVRVWSGWAMIAASAVTAAGAAVLGHLKSAPAGVLHNRALLADADMSRADWQVGVATIAGVFGVGLGLWWADALAAIVVSLSILSDGLKNLRTLASELLDRAPQRIDTGTDDPILRRAARHVASLPWVRSVSVRMHERGHTLAADVFVVPRAEVVPVATIDDALASVYALDWRIVRATITPVSELPDAPGTTAGEGEGSSVEG